MLVTMSGCVACSLGRLNDTTVLQAAKCSSCRASSIETWSHRSWLGSTWQLTDQGSAVDRKASWQDVLMGSIQTLRALRGGRAASGLVSDPLHVACPM